MDGDNKIQITEQEKLELEMQKKTAKINVEKWVEKNKEELAVLKQKELKEKVENRIIENNKDLNMEERGAVSEYSQIIGQVFFPKKGGNDKYKNELKNEEQTEDDWADVSVLNTVLKMQSSQFDDFLDKFKSVKSKMAKVELPPDIVECRSVERVIELVEVNKEINDLVHVDQKYVNTYSGVGNYVGGKLKQWGMEKLGGSMMERIGMQTTKEFTKESLAIMTKSGAKEGIVTILKGVLSGGVKAASAGTAGAAGTVAAGGVVAVQAVPVVGQIILIGTVAVGAVKKINNKIIKPVVGVVKDLFGKLGIDLSGLSFGTKKFFQKHMGKFFGGIIDGGIKVAMVAVAIPGILLAAPLTILVGPTIIFLIIGLMIYSTLNSNLISSLVPPVSMGGDTSQPIHSDPPVEPIANLPESCPSMWPSDHGCITQGPQTTGTHEGSEAIDIGCLSFGDPVLTTHDGVATPVWSEGCGYGVDISGTCNGIKFNTRFCHFPGHSLSGPTQVRRGDTVGIVDSTGISSGNHIHYSLVSLGDINNFLPRRVTSGCINFGPCGSMRINSIYD